MNWWKRNKDNPKLDIKLSEITSHISDDGIVIENEEDDSTSFNAGLGQEDVVETNDETLELNPVIPQINWDSDHLPGEPSQQELAVIICKELFNSEYIELFEEQVKNKFTEMVISETIISEHEPPDLTEEQSLFVKSIIVKLMPIIKNELSNFLNRKN